MPTGAKTTACEILPQDRGLGLSLPILTAGIGGNGLAGLRGGNLALRSAGTGSHVRRSGMREVRR
jgi:hypothetical protein